MRKNDIITTLITGMSAEGNGVCRDETGFTVFVPNTAIGDKLTVRILKVLKNYAFGKVEQIIEPSQSRVESDCGSFAKCGGCVYRHISYAEELKIKYERVQSAMERIGGFKNLQINSIVGADNIDFYRNKAQLPVGIGPSGSVEVGFYAVHSHRIIDNVECNLQPELFNRVVKIFREFMAQTDNEPYNELTHKGKVRHLYIRYGEATGELMVCVVVNGGGLKREDKLLQMLLSGLPELKTVVINTNTDRTNVILGNRNRVIYGNGYIEDILCGKRFRISPLSFYQVNRQQAEKLYNIAKDYANLDGTQTLLDLYCGTGTIGITMSDKCKKLIGVEVIDQAIQDANINASINGVEGAEFICGDSVKAAEILHEKGIRPNVIVVDPPRKGCSADLIDTIVDMSPDRVVYVSCDPATLARDLKLFAHKDYQITELTPVDLFPRTAHVECVVSLIKVRE